MKLATYLLDPDTRRVKRVKVRIPNRETRELRAALVHLRMLAMFEIARIVSAPKTEGDNVR